MRDELAAPRLTTRLTPALAVSLVAMRTHASRLVATARRIVPPFAFSLVILLWLVPFLIAGLKDAVVYDGSLFDGPLQVFNPLRRIDAGQRGGADFQSFHGIGLPYLYYPLYALAGKTIHASELSRHWLETLQVLLGYLVVFGAATRRLTPTLGLTAAALVVTTQLPLVHLAEGVGTPIGLRSVTPLLVLGVLLASMRPGREAVACGALAAVGVLIGTEHGLATLVMLGLTWAGRRRLGLAGRSLRWLLVSLLSFAVVLVGLLLLIGGPVGAVRAMSYAFHEIPADQFWYFGAPPNEFLARWSQLADRRLWVNAVGPLLVGFVSLVEVIRSYPQARPVAVVLLAALAGGALGLVGYLGYVSLHYMLPAQRTVLVVGMLGLWYAGRRAATNSLLGPVVARVGAASVAALTVACLVIGPRVPTAHGLAATLREGRAAASDFLAGRTRLSDRLSAHIGELTRAIDADRAAADITRPPVIWSTYAGLLESHYGVFHPYRDYLIHAVGPTGRDEYLAAFRAAKPDYVLTMRRDGGTFPYEEQHQNGGWPFYEEVLLNYDVRAVTRESVLWNRRPGTWQMPDTHEGVSRPPDGPNWFRVVAPPGVGPESPLVVEVEYEVRNRLRWLPVIGQTPRHLLAPTACHNATPISLPPYRTKWTFAVYPILDRTPTVYAGTFSLIGGGVTIKRVHVRPLRADGRDRAIWNLPTLPTHR